MKKWLSVMLTVCLLAVVLSCGMFSITAQAYVEGPYSYYVENGEAQLVGISTDIGGAVVVPSELGGYPVTAISGDAFSRREDIISVVIPDGVKTIGANAFYDCTGLSGVDIPESVTSIGAGAFENCSSLVDIILPDGITSVMAYTFQNCESLARITIPDSVTSIGWNAFDSCKSLVSITVPDSVTDIDDGAFEDCENLSEVVLGNGLTSIGNGAFQRCPNLKKITIPNSVTSIDKWAFFRCTGLESIVIPDSVKSMGSNAFDSCTGLESVTLGKGLTNIAESTFASCTALKNISFGGVKSIGRYAFEECESLTSLTIPNGVTEIAESAFKDCINLKSIALPNSLTTMEQRIFDGCTSLTSVTVPGSVEIPGYGMFFRCENLTTVTISEGVKELSERVFFRCKGLTTVSLPESLEKVGNEAFSGCSALKSLTLPKGVTCVEYGAFNDCTAIETLKVYNKDCEISSECYLRQECTVYGHKDSTAKEYAEMIGAKFVELPPEHTHSYSNSCDKTCNICGATRTVGAHKYSNSCDKTCNICGAKRTVGAHKYTNSCDATCNICSAKRTVKHTYSNACDTSCNVCKATRTAVHAYKTTTTKATLTKDGKVVKKCTVCGKTASTTTVKYPKTFSLSAVSYNYDGKVKTPTVTVTDTAGKTLKKDTDYTVTYASGRKTVGTYKVTVKMIGKYSGTKTLTFKIGPAVMSIYKLSATAYTYNGKVRTPSVTVKDTAGKVLKEDTDYTVTYASGRRNAGTYKVTVKGKGKYSGTKILTFKINPIDLSKCRLSLSETSYKYNGKVKTPTVTVKNASGTVLKKDTHYTVKYASGRKAVGTYKVNVVGRGNYTGTKTLTFKVVPKAASIKSLTGKSKAMTVKLNTVSSQATGYEVQYSTTANLQLVKMKDVPSYKTSSVSITGLSAKKTYYVRVRTYKTVDGKKIYSGWSAVKSVKTK